MDVVILAGGRCDPEFAKAAGVELRADVPFHGRTCAEWVLEAVRNIGDPILVGGPRGLTQRQVPAGETFLESVRQGLQEVSSESFLLVTADIPLVTEEALSDFLSGCDEGAAINYPVIPLDVCERAYPGVKRTTLRLAEGRVTGGNVALLKKPAMESALGVLERAYDARKSKLQLARIIGPGVVLQVGLSALVPGSLTLAKLERSVGRFLGVPVRAVVSQYPAIGTDIDSATQYKTLLDLTKPA